MLSDGPLNLMGCSSSSGDACNLRSAWAYCMEQLTFQVFQCSYDETAIGCKILLEAGGVYELTEEFGGSLVLDSGLEGEIRGTVGMTPCQVSIAINSDEPQQPAIIQGNNTAMR